MYGGEEHHLFQNFYMSLYADTEDQQAAQQGSKFLSKIQLPTASEENLQTNWRFALQLKV